MTRLLIRLFVKENNNVDNPIVRQRYGLLGSIVGIIFNVLIFTTKLIAGILMSSVAIIADSFNNLSDAGSSIIALIGFKISGKPADKEHPFGHGRSEYIAGLLVSVIIIIVGLELFKSSIEKVFAINVVTKIDLFTIIVLSISILIKIWLSVFNSKIAKTISSHTMQATAADSISDVVATSTVLIGLIVGHYANIAIDGYLGIAVAGFVVYTGVMTMKETLSQLLGRSPDPKLVKEIGDYVLAQKFIVGIHDLIIHEYGPGRLMISLHAEIPAKENLIKMHDVIDEIEIYLKRKYGCNVTIHMDPVATNDAFSNELKQKVGKIIEAISPEIGMHDFRLVKHSKNVNVIFDIVIPYKFDINEEELMKKIEVKVKEIDSHFNVIISAIDRDI